MQNKLCKRFGPPCKSKIEWTRLCSHWVLSFFAKNGEIWINRANSMWTNPSSPTFLYNKIEPASRSLWSLRVRKNSNNLQIKKVQNIKHSANSTFFQKASHKLFHTRVFHKLPFARDLFVSFSNVVSGLVWAFNFWSRIKSSHVEHWLPLKIDFHGNHMFAFINFIYWKRSFSVILDAENAFMDWN
jgi:hypothetical protein